jgi:hypothetical protein
MFQPEIQSPKSPLKMQRRDGRPVERAKKPNVPIEPIIWDWASGPVLAATVWKSSGLFYRALRPLGPVQKLRGRKIARLEKPNA